MFRVVVQDSRVTPTSGKVVALLGSYDPHTKVASLDKEKAATYLKNGAQPSERAARLLKSEGVKLPEWVSFEAKKSGKVKNPDKLRKNQSSAEATDDKPSETEPEAAAEAEAPAEEAAAEAPAEAPAEEEAQ